SMRLSERRALQPSRPSLVPNRWPTYRLFMKFEPSTRRSSIASDFVVLVLDGCLNCGDADR
ncbi:MAG: hypothetical protein NT168_10530, partial [Planctomycetota bacterium]|nr:hypothetical protein [Planctomycetota bacterium]